MNDTSLQVSELSPNMATREPVATATVVNFNAPHQYVDIGHSQLAYWRVGEGPNLILVHGWPLHSATYRGVLPHLAKHFTCHLFDFPGAGKTKTGSDAPLGLEAHSESLLSAVKQLGIEQYALLGHDSGGAIMQFLAEKDADNVVGLVMGDTETPGYQSPMMSAFLMAGRIPGFAELHLTCLRFKWLRQSDMGFGSCFNDKGLIEGEFYEWFLKPMLSSAERRYWQAALLRNFNKADILKLINIQNNITVPVQLLWGSKDKFFLLADAKRMMSRFKGKKELHVFEGGKLFIHEEYPEKFAKKVIEFLKAS